MCLGRAETKASSLLELQEQATVCLSKTERDVCGKIYSWAGEVCGT